VPRRIWLVTALTLLPATAHAVEADRAASARPLSVLLLLGALSLVPFVLVMITSFVRISVVLHILRAALGTPQVPPTMVITGLAVILTAYVMAPTGSRVIEAVQPVVSTGAGQGLLSAGGAEAVYQAALRAREPVRQFLVQHSSPRDRAMFRDLARRMRPPAQRVGVGERDLLVVVPAFVIGELAAAFQIGFLLFLPFLVVDMVVANILLALGMHMLSPTTVSLPFKLLLFVLVDGWHLLTQGLVLAYAG